MKQTITIFPSVEELAAALGGMISRLLQAKPEDQNLSLVLSGGSTPRAIYRILAEKYAAQTDWNRILFFWGDERCVPPDSPESNYKMARETLLAPLGVPEQNIFRIQGENQPETEAGRYGETVRRQLSRADALPRPDLLLLGLGEDGHTASLFPGQMGLLDSEALFAVARHPQSGQKRITATGRFIQQARRVVFLVTGENKAAIVARILEKQSGWEKLPAARVQPVAGELFWFLDSAAAGELIDSP